MSTYVRMMLLIMGILVLGIAPALAEGQATGKRTHKPLRFRMYYDQPVNLDGQDLTIGGLMEEEGVFFVMLPQDSDKWDKELLLSLTTGPKAEAFADVAIIAVYPNTKYVKYVQEELDYLAGFMQVSLMDTNTRAFLPEPNDEVLVAFFAAPKAEYRGAFRTLDGLAYEMQVIE